MPTLRIPATLVLAACQITLTLLDTSSADDGRPTPPQTTATGQPFEIDPEELGDVVYETSFDDPLQLRDWSLEGGLRAMASDGKLVLESRPAANSVERSRDHLVFWLQRRMPANFLLEFSVRPRDRRDGLNIVFFAARGVGGESVLDPALRTRDGTFAQYHSGDLNNYHVSYWAGDRGTANLRKNKGFHLVATGPDLVAPAAAAEFQTVSVYKREGKIRVLVDGKLSVAYDDDGRAFGAVHTQPGWIGLRQMGHTLRCEYDHLRVVQLR